MNNQPFIPNNQQPVSNQPTSFGSNQIQPNNLITPPQSSNPVNQSTSQTISQNPNSTQNFLQIAEIKDGIIILKDGTFRSIIACQSINFELMSLTEREGVEYAFQGFLNSLYFPIQIFIRSQKVDITPYINKLVNLRNQQDNMLLNVLMDDYINYIDLLAQEANIMEKTFYVIVPYMPAGDIISNKNQVMGIFSKINNKPITNVRVNEKVFLNAKDEINNRVNLLISGLTNIGIQTERLNTEKINQLYYNFYNPDTILNKPIVDFSQITNLYSKKGDGTNNNQNKGEI